MKLAYAYDRKKNPTEYEFRFISLDELMNLSYGKHVDFIRLQDGKVGTLKVNGQIRTWKRDKERIELPVKYGLYEYATLNKTECLNKLVVRVQE